MPQTLVNAQYDILTLTNGTDLLLLNDNTSVLYIGSALNASIPIQWVPLTGQTNVAISSVTTLTVPSGAAFAQITALVGAAFYTTDGTTPTITSYEGTIAVNTSANLQGYATLNALKIIGANSTTQMDVLYWR